MNTFKYTITKFDADNKIVVVTFENGKWAEIRLTTPLPTTVEQLEAIIKRFTDPIEYMHALVSDVDLSYIDALVGQERESNRYSERLNMDATASFEADMQEIDDLEESRLKVLIKETVAELIERNEIGTVGLHSIEV